MVNNVQYTSYLDVSSNEQFHGKMNINFFLNNNINSNNEYLPIDFKGLQINNLKINDNENMNIEWNEDKLNIPLSKLKTDDHNNIYIEYTNLYSKTSLGLYRYVDPIDNKV